MSNISWIFIGLLIIFPYHDALKSYKKKHFFRKYLEGDKICDANRNLCGPYADCSRIGNTYQCLCHKDGIPEEGPGCYHNSVYSERCLRNQFQCAYNKQCIPEIWRCDGVKFDNKHNPGCRDGSDELDCDNHQCKEGEHRCGNGWCIPPSWVCDNEKHCEDGSDEKKNCTLTSGAKCLRNEFQCVNGQCVPMSLRCNGLRGDACTDYSDESKCDEVWCPEGHFRCAFEASWYGGQMRCFPNSFICDGASNCVDNSDEKDCDRVVKCDEKKEFACLSGDECVEKDYHCDGVEDCRDGTDETDCIKCREPCQNRGTCPVANKTCSCKGDFRGDACQNHKSLCSIVQKGNLDSRWECDDWSNGTTCSISCDPFQTESQTDDTKMYNCSTDGHWKPKLPSCVQTFCYENEHRCGAGNCVKKSYICDKANDCTDGSDEKDCYYKETEYVFFNKGLKVYKKNMTIGSEASPIEIRGVPSTGEKIITGLSFSVKHQELFISYVDGPAIYAVNINTLWKRALVGNNIDFPVDIAFDWTSDNLYWIDSGRGTVEVVSVDPKLNRRSVIISGLTRPVSLALLPDRGIMFIAAATQTSYGIFEYEMDGRNRRLLYTVDESPASLALHPSKTLLYWTDNREGTISYGNYSSSSSYSVLRKGVGGILSLTVSEDKILFTTEEEEEVPKEMLKFKVGEHKKNGNWKSIASTFSSPKKYYPGRWYTCLNENGGCGFLCLTNKLNRSCACSSDKMEGIVDGDGKSCTDVCEIPVIKDECRKTFPRWYYYESEDECFEFIDCHENSDRFKDKEACEQRCKKTPVPVTTEAPPPPPSNKK